MPFSTPYLSEALEFPNTTNLVKNQMFNWWFNPKNSYSVIKIPLGILFIILFIISLIMGFLTLINAFWINPVYTGMILLVFFFFLPIFFGDAVFFGGLLYLPYYVFNEESQEKRNWKTLLKYIGILFIAATILNIIRTLAFGFAYPPF